VIAVAIIKVRNHSATIKMSSNKSFSFDLPEAKLDIPPADWILR